MNPDEPFPLEAVHSRVRNAILREFNGRCPSLRDVAQIPNKQWSTTPGVGSAALKTIRSIIDAEQQQVVTDAAPSMVSDADLLMRLERLEEDLRRLQHHLKERMLAAQRRKLHPKGHRRVTRSEVDRLLHRVRAGGASRSPSR